MLKSETLTEVIPKLKITEQLFNELNKIVETTNNKDTEIKVGLPDLRRQALKDFVQGFYKDGLTVQFKFENGDKNAA